MKDEIIKRTAPNLQADWRYHFTDDCWNISDLLISLFNGIANLSNQSPAIFYDQEGEIIEDSFGDSYEWVSLDNIDPSAIQATLIIEDNRFFDHNGLDFIRIAKSLWNNFVSGSLKEGASTITQQYARNLYLSPKKTWSRKLQEAFYAIRLEMFYSKEEILEGYMNTIYYGHGAHGIEAASNYFLESLLISCPWQKQVCWLEFQRTYLLFSIK